MKATPKEADKEKDEKKGEPAGNQVKQGLKDKAVGAKLQVKCPLRCQCGGLCAYNLGHNSVLASVPLPCKCPACKGLCLILGLHE